MAINVSVRILNVSFEVLPKTVKGSTLSVLMGPVWQHVILICVVLLLKKTLTHIRASKTPTLESSKPRRSLNKGMQQVASKC